MKLITAIIRPEKLATVKEALFAAGVTGITISRASGHGGEREVLEHIRGASYPVEFHDRVHLSIGVSDSFVDLAIKAIVSAAQTGQVGDGKIFVQPLERALRIRSGEENEAVVTPMGEARGRQKESSA